VSLSSSANGSAKINLRCRLRSAASRPAPIYWRSVPGFGWIIRGPAGAIVALLASSIPCAILVAALTALLASWQDNHLVQAALHGAIAAAVGITTKTCWTIAHPYFKGRDGQIRVVLIGAVAFALYVFAHIPPIWVLILAAVVGTFLPEPRS
jgi:chromate transporter